MVLYNSWCVFIATFTVINEQYLFLCLVLDAFEQFYGEPIRERGRVLTKQRKVHKKSL